MAARLTRIVVGAAAVFGLVAGASTVPPLLRAIHIDPGIALRYE